MPVIVKSNGHEFGRLLTETSKAGITAAATHLFTAVQNKLNVLYPPSSKPGEAPHRRSGDGRRSVFLQVEDAPEGLGGPTARVGTSGARLAAQGRSGFNYMAHWESHGRPWLLNTLTEELSALQAIVESHKV